MRVHTSEANANVDTDTRAIKTSVNVTWRRRKKKENFIFCAQPCTAFALASQISKSEWRWRRRKFKTIFACVACITFIAGVNVLAFASLAWTRLNREFLLFSFFQIVRKMSKINNGIISREQYLSYVRSLTFSKLTYSLSFSLCWIYNLNW